MLCRVLRWGFVRGSFEALVWMFWERMLGEVVESLEEVVVWRDEVVSLRSTLNSRCWDEWYV